MAPGIIGTVRLAVVLAFAAPALAFGADRLLAGQPAVGVAFLALGGLMLLLERYLTNPFDPGDVAEIVVDRLTGRE
ncbi:MAG: hypothetical protein ABEI39_01770 [Halobacteriales archaeon]